MGARRDTVISQPQARCMLAACLPEPACSEAGSSAMTPRAAADFGSIRRRMDEIEGERSGQSVTSRLVAAAGAGDALPQMERRNRHRRRADLVLGRTLSGKKFILTEKGRRLHLHMPGLSG